MNLLLTSAGISNTSIHDALVDLLGKSIAESSALCIPTAAYACPGGAGMAWRLISGSAKSPLCELGWKSLGVLELTALPSIDEKHWIPMVQETDVLLVGGGDILYKVSTTADRCEFRGKGTGLSRNRTELRSRSGAARPSAVE
jgi:dipeptidase E